MRSALAAAAGLFVGVVVAFGAAATVYMLVPTQSVAIATAAPLTPPVPTPTPTLAPTPVATPPPTASPSPTAEATPTPAGSPRPSGARTPSPEPTSPFRLLDGPAPGLIVARVGGGTIDLASFRGRPVWIVFTASSCPPCRDEYPLMNGYSVRYAEAGLVVLAVHVRESEAVVAGFARDMAVAFPVGLDPDGAHALTWDAAVLPVHYWIDASGTIRDAAMGGIGPDTMQRGLAAILPGAAP